LVYAILTVAGIATVYFVMTKKAVESAIATASKEKGESDVEGDDELSKMSAKEKLKFYIKNFPLKDLRFLYFIFILIPVQTLFAHNWLTLPLYTSRAFAGFVKDNFEFFVNLKPNSDFHSYSYGGSPYSKEKRLYDDDNWYFCNGITYIYPGVGSKYYDINDLSDYHDNR